MNKSLQKLSIVDAYISTVCSNKYKQILMEQDSYQNSLIQIQSSDSEYHGLISQQQQETQTSVIRRWMPDELIKHITFNEKHKRRQVRKIFSSNLRLMLKYLYLQKKSHIIQFKKIRNKTNIIKIRMERGSDCWYTENEQTTVEQKINYITDVCKGLLQLTAMNIFQFDLNPGNIVKVGNTFKLIDFEHAYLCKKSEETKTKLYINKQLDKVEEQLFAASQKLLQFQLRDYFTQSTSSFSRYIYNQKKIQIGYFGQIKNSKEEVDIKISKGLQFFKKHIEHLNGCQLVLLLQQVFSKQQIQSIDAYRKGRKTSKMIFLELQQLINDLKDSINNQKTAPLKEFYSKFCLVGKHNLQSSSKNNLQNRQLRFVEEAEYIQTWRNKLTKLMIRNEVQANFAIGQETKIFIPYQISLKEIFKYKNGQNLEDTFENNRQVFYENQQQNIANLQNIIKYIEVKKNYSSLRLAFLDQLGRNKSLNQNKFKYLVSIYHYRLIDNNILHLQVDGVASNTFWMNEQEKIKSIWSQGFTNMLRCISDICKAFITLQDTGFYHPDVGFDAINEFQNQYRIGRLEKAFAVDFDRLSSEYKFKIQNLAEMLFSNIFQIDHSKQKLQYQNLLYNQMVKIFPQIESNVFSSIYQELDQMDCYMIEEYELIRRKNRILKMHIRANYKKNHAIQLGNLLRQLFQYEEIYNPRKMADFNENPQSEADGLHRVSNILCPKYEQQNYRQLVNESSKLLSHGLSVEQLDIRTFLALVQKKYEFCNKHPKDLLSYSYLMKNGNKMPICDKCLIQKLPFPSENIQIQCLNHKKIIKYKETNREIQSKMTRKYYCEDCFYMLQYFNCPKLVDNKDLQQCKYLCLNTNCTENLISSRNKEENHNEHKVVRLSNINQLIAKMKNKAQQYVGDKWMKTMYSNTKSQLEKGVNFHFERIDEIFQSLLKFNEKNDYFQRMITSLGLSAFSRYEKPQKVNKEMFFKLIKVVENLQEINNNHGRSQISITSSLNQYMIHTYKKISEETSKQINDILKKSAIQIQRQIFNPNVQELYNNVIRSLDEKYRTVFNNFQTQQCSPAPLLNISKRYDHIVEKLTIVEKQSELEHYLCLKERFLLEAEKYNKSKINILNNISELIEKEDLQENILMCGRKYEEIGSSVERLYKDQKSDLQQLLNSLSSNKSQIYNRKAILQKQSNIIDQLQLFRLMFEDIKGLTNYKQNKPTKQHQNEVVQQWKQIKNLLNKDLKYLTDNIKFKSQAFKFQIQVLPVSINQNIIKRITTFKNLKQLSLTTNPNYGNHCITINLDREYVMTALILKKIFEYCRKLQKVSFKGGDIQIYDCLKVTSQLCNRSNLIIYLYSNNAIREYSQLKDILPLLQMKFKVPTLKLRIKKTINETEKDLLIKVISKLEELQLQVEGPFSKNGFIIDILNFIIERKNLKMTTLLLKRVNLQKYIQIWQKLMMKSQLTEISLHYCNNYPQNIFFLSQSEILKHLYIIGEDKTQVESKIIPNSFMAGLFQLQKLISLRLHNIKIEEDKREFNLSHLANLKFISLRYCQWFTPSFLGSLPLSTIHQIQGLDLAACGQVNHDFLEPIQKMKALRFTNLYETDLGIQGLLKFESEKIESIKLRQFKDTTDYNLSLLDKKWPQLRSIDLNRCLKITIQAFQDGKFQNLRELFGTIEGFTLQDNFFLNERRIMIDQYN